MTAQAGSASSPSGPSLAADVSATREDMRRMMRAKRLALSSALRSAAARDISRRIVGGHLLRPRMRIAVYLPVRGEVDLAPLITHALRLKCRLYLPRVIDLKARRMEFFRFHDLKSLTRSRLGLLEPAAPSNPVNPRTLDRVFVPLTAFDIKGHRIGTGGGFYDRRFAYLKAGRGWRRPRLIGVAYDLQKVPRVDVQPWDVTLDAVVTERAVYGPQIRNNP